MRWKEINKSHFLWIYKKDYIILFKNYIQNRIKTTIYRDKKLFRDLFLSIYSVDWVIV